MRNKGIAELSAEGIPARRLSVLNWRVVDEAAIQLRYEALAPVLDERSRRRFAAAEARAAGRGGVSAVSRVTGLARSTIIRDLAELVGDVNGCAASGRVRRPGGGRKKLTETDPTLLSDLKSLVEPTTPRRSASAAAVDQPQPAQPGRGSVFDGAGRQPGHEIALQR